MPSLLQVVRAPARDGAGAVAVPRRWPNSTILCAASGPSLTQADLEACRGRWPTIAVNDTVRWAPWAIALMASDSAWWRYHAVAVADFAGLKYCLDARGDLPDGVVRLVLTGREGIETDPTGLRSGGNSGAAAINLAVHFGASRIVLLGYDMGHGRRQRSHFFGDHPPSLRRQSPFHSFRLHMTSQREPLAALGIEVINCSRESALTCFPRRALEDVLCRA